MFRIDLSNRILLGRVVEEGWQQRVAFSRRKALDQLRGHVAPGLRKNFTGCAYSGGVQYPSLSMGGMQSSGPVVIDLDSIRIPSQVRPVLDDHDESTDGKIGETTAIRNDGCSLEVEGYLFAQKSRTKRLLSILNPAGEWGLSLGGDMFETERISSDQSIQLNQRQFTGPLTIVYDFYLTEISFVTDPADPDAYARLQARRRKTAGRSLDEQIADAIADTITQESRRSIRAAMSIRR